MAVQATALSGGDIINIFKLYMSSHYLPDPQYPQYQYDCNPAKHHHRTFGTIMTSHSRHDDDNSTPVHLDLEETHILPPTRPTSPGTTQATAQPDQEIPSTPQHPTITSLLQHISLSPSERLHLTHILSTSTLGGSSSNTFSTNLELATRGLLHHLDNAHAHIRFDVTLLENLADARGTNLHSPASKECRDWQKRLFELRRARLELELAVLTMRKDLGFARAEELSADNEEEKEGHATGRKWAG